jgi:hypothetical protein
MLKGLYFIFISVLTAFLFYIFFGLLLSYNHHFFNIIPFHVFLSSQVILSLIVYVVCLHGEARKLRENLSVMSRKTVLILVSTMILSAVFPASALVGFYPVHMAMFHLLMLFYAGISVGAVSASAVIFLLRNGNYVYLFNKYAFTFAVLLSLGISYMTLIMFLKLPRG